MSLREGSVARITIEATVSLDNRETVPDAIYILTSGGGTYAIPAPVITDAYEIKAPQLPRPDEPQGLGAVVEDEDGDKFVRVNGRAGGWRQSTGGRPGRYLPWSDIKAVKVLGEGVS